jgi:RNA polymerase sigma-70 factor (ECF subfamily)
MNRSEDSRLVAGLKARDQKAVKNSQIVTAQPFISLPSGYLKSREDAEEVTQDVLMKVYRKIDAFRGDSALSSWIYRISVQHRHVAAQEFAHAAVG